MPAYEDYVDSSNIAVAKADLVKVSQAIEQYYLKTSSFPNSLTDIGFDTYQDPWGNNYRYLNISTVTTGVGPLRKDRNLNPVNSDYDLYSVGKDGVTSSNFSAQRALDDIVRANNGKYIGLASDY
ncbi:MAG: type II secretion system protein GspG [Gammaproteobacteria bacterium]|nr:type II secretion system protein GspG [Gammaproteobacteria bacterium]MDH5801012.1 type II secretion system protein GspG [Gammaproteobacteria bacterium]